MNATELMSPAPAVVAADDTLQAAASLMRDRNVGMLPVVEGRTSRLVGVITDRDIVVRGVARGHGSTAKVHEHMTRDALVTVTADATLSEIGEKMRRHQVRRLPVLDRNGAVVGVVAQADLVLAVGPHDPALVERVVEGISRPGALVAQP